MNREQIFDKIEEIQDKVDKMGFNGSNEHDLILREELTDWMVIHLDKGLEKYLIDVGIRASDDGHIISEKERKLLKDNVEYFVKCHSKELSAYKALLFFHDYLKGDYKI
jgi:hypothetical protein